MAERGVDAGTVSVCGAVLLLLSGLWDGKPVATLAEQSAVLGAVLFLSLFRSFPLRSHTVRPRLQPVRVLEAGLTDPNTLEIGDFIEVQTGDILPTACEVISSKGNFQVSPSLCQFGIVKSGSAVLKVLKPVESSEVTENWRLPARIQATISLIFKLVVAFEVLQALQMTWKSHSHAVHAAAEAATMLWLVWEVSKSVPTQLSHTFLQVPSSPTVSFWRRWQAGSISSVSTVHLSTLDEFVYSLPRVTSILRPGSENCCVYKGQGQRLHWEVEGVEFDKWWFLLATHCAVSSRADLVSWEGGLQANGSGVDTALRLVAEGIGLHDPGFHSVQSSLSPEQYSEQICRGGSVHTRKSDQMGHWTLRKTSEGYQTLLRGDKSALSLCSLCYNEGRLSPLDARIRAKFEEFEGIVLCIKLHSEAQIQTTDLALLAGLDIESRPKTALLDAVNSLPDALFVISTSSEAETTQLMAAFPSASIAASPPASPLVLLPESQAAHYLSSLSSPVLSTSLVGGLTLAGVHSSVSRRIQADIVLKTESLAGLVTLVRECRRVVGVGTWKALFLLKCVVAVLVFGMGKQVLGRREHLDLPWTALALVFCGLMPAYLANKQVLACSAVFTRNTGLHACVCGAAIAALALFIENQCFLQPEWLLDPRSPSFLSESPHFSVLLQGTGLKSLQFALLFDLFSSAPSLRAFLASLAAWLACALAVSCKSGLGLASPADLWTLAGAVSLHLTERLVLRLYRP